MLVALEPAEVTGLLQPGAAHWWICRGSMGTAQCHCCRGWGEHRAAPWSLSLHDLSRGWDQRYGLLLLPRTGCSMGTSRLLFAVPIGRSFPNPLKFGPRESYSSAISFRGTPNWPGMFLQLPCHHEQWPQAAAASLLCPQPALLRWDLPEPLQPPAQPCPTSAFWPKLCCTPKAVPCPWKQKGPSWGEQWRLEPANSTTGTGSGLSFSVLVPDSVTPGLGWEGVHWWLRLELGDWGVGSGTWWLATPPGLALCSWWVCRNAGETSGLTGKREEPQPLPCGKSPSEPLVNLDAIPALLCQSHQPCLSRRWRRHRSQPPTEPPFLSPGVRGMLLPRLLPGV